MILGITGGTGCGKTTLLKQIEKAGGLVLDCDAIYHNMLERDAVLLAAIESRFPGTVENGVLRRKRLGAVVFADSEALLALNAITHGAIRQEICRRLESAPELAAIDAIALHDAGLDGLCDTTVAVLAPMEDRIRRLMLRDSISEAYARSRIAAQHDNNWFAAHCRHVLYNDGTPAEFASKCIDFLKDLGIITCEMNWGGSER